MKHSDSSRYEMGYTIEEFSRVLHGDFTGNKSDFKTEDLTGSRWLITHTQSDLNIHIDVRQLPPRELGLLKLPVLQVDFNGIDLSSTGSTLFFDKFFKYFHKGGG